jgi:predicted RNA binding protein YcfA (HicA-like mRNA interferase family)
VSTQKRIRELEKKGYVVTKTNGQHLRLTKPGVTGVVFTSSTPGDGARGDKELQRNLRHVFGRSET